jgi:hypothetical protein
MIAASDICRVIAATRFDLSTEKAVQVGMAGVLIGAFGESAVAREKRLSPADIPDFLIAGVAIEVKIKGQRKSAIWKQLVRYAAHSEVSAVVLVTNVSMGLPALCNGKPAYYVSLGRAWL